MNIVRWVAPIGISPRRWPLSFKAISSAESSPSSSTPFSGSGSFWYSAWNAASS